MAWCEFILVGLFFLIWVSVGMGMVIIGIRNI